MISNLKIISISFLITTVLAFGLSYKMKINKIENLEKEIVLKQKEINKIVSINKSNIEIYEEKISTIKRQIEEIEKINKDQEIRLENKKVLGEKIDIKLKDKTIIEKNIILNKELNEIIKSINEK